MADSKEEMETATQDSRMLRLSVKFGAIVREIEMLDSQTLENLHNIIFQSFNRYEEHLYSFTFPGSRAYERLIRLVPNAARDLCMYQFPTSTEHHTDFTRDVLQRIIGPLVTETLVKQATVGRPKSYTGGGFSKSATAEMTKLSTLGLRVGDQFRYLFDFGDSLQHSISVEADGPAEPGVEYPRITKRIGLSPPQYPFYSDGESDGEDEGGSGQDDSDDGEGGDPDGGHDGAPAIPDDEAAIVTPEKQASSTKNHGDMGAQPAPQEKEETASKRRKIDRTKSIDKILLAASSAARADAAVAAAADDAAAVAVAAAAAADPNDQALIDDPYTAAELAESRQYRETWEGCILQRWEGRSAATMAEGYFCERISPMWTGVFPFE